MNVVVLIGRLVRDPEIRYTSGQTQTAIANFRIAVDRRFKREGQPDADFFTASAFGKMAEFVGKYFHQGSKIVIQGRIQNDNYTDKNGNTGRAERIGHSKTGTGPEAGRKRIHADPERD